MILIHEIILLSLNNWHYIASVIVFIIGLIIIHKILRDSKNQNLKRAISRPEGDNYYETPAYMRMEEDIVPYRDIKPYKPETIKPRRSINTATLAKNNTANLEKKPVKPIFLIEKQTAYVQDRDSYDRKFIRDKVIRFLSVTKPNGAGYRLIEAYVWGCVRGDQPKKIIPDDFQTFLKKSLNKIEVEGIITYQMVMGIWKINKKQYEEKNRNREKLLPITDSEKRYFGAKGLGDGWYRLSNKTSGMEAIWWMHRNFNPDEFEQFCCAVLAHHNVTDVEVSEKEGPYEIDGGIDGYGSYHLNGRNIDVAIQAKLYKPSRFVTRTETSHFVGSLHPKEMNYGFLITTATFSERAQEMVELTAAHKTNPIHIELIDQNALIECMTYRGDSPHGFGLHKTDDLGFYYLNPEMLRREIAKYRKKVTESA